MLHFLTQEAQMNANTHPHTHPYTHTHTNSMAKPVHRMEQYFSNSIPVTLQLIAGTIICKGGNSDSLQHSKTYLPFWWSWDPVSS